MALGDRDQRDDGCLFGAVLGAVAVPALLLRLYRSARAVERHSGQPARTGGLGRTGAGRALSSHS
jgi:hypothetical protein